jgi:phosphatidylglycerol:prolipoprotein diacylglycerol transferase
LYPILFEINGIPIYAHGFFLFMALLAGTAWLSVEARRRRWPKEEIFPITLAAFVGGMVGARISIVFFNGWETAPVILDFYRLFDPRIGPGSVLGGVAGAYIAGFITSRAIGKSGCACDAFAPAMALAMVIGRFGCFLSGEDGLGKTTNLPWGVWVWTSHGNGQLVHPAPLYDAAFNLAWFSVLLLMRDHPKMQNGNLLKFGLAGYAVFRFLVEFVRNNRILLWGLTGQQWFCLVLLLMIGTYYTYQYHRSKRLSAI